MGNLPFSQKMSGALLISVIGSLIVWILTGVEWKKEENLPPAVQTTGQQSGSNANPPVTPLLRVQSSPAGAEIYLNWQPKGRTPASFQQAELNGLLVLIKDGYEAIFQSLDSSQNTGLDFSLKPETTRPAARMILLSNTNAESFSVLRNQLSEEGFTIVTIEQSEELKTESSKAGGVSNRAFRAWVRAKYDADYLTVADLQQSIRESGDQDIGNSRAQEALRGVYRANVTVHIEVFDLRSGNQIANASGKGNDFALDRQQAFEKALIQATSQSAKLLHEKILT